MKRHFISYVRPSPHTHRLQRESYAESITWTNGNVSHAIRHSWERFQAPTLATSESDSCFGSPGTKVPCDSMIASISCSAVSNRFNFFLSSLFHKRLCGTYVWVFAAVPRKTTKFAMRRTTDQTALISRIVLIARKIWCVFVCKNET